MVNITKTVKNWAKKLGIIKDWKLPTSWDDITLQQVIDFHDMNLLETLYGEHVSNYDVIIYKTSVITKVPQQIYYNMKATDFTKILEHLDFINDTNTNQFQATNIIKIDGKKWGMCDIFTDDKIVKYIVIEEFNKNYQLLERVAANDYNAVLDLLTIVCNEIGTDYDRTERGFNQRKDKLRNISFKDAMGLLNFFLQNINNLGINTPHFSIVPV